MTTPAVKILARRDSCTSALRKLGVNSRDYNAFIELQANGQFKCLIGAAEAHLQGLAKPAVKKSPSEKTVKIGLAPVPKAEKPAKVAKPAKAKDLPWERKPEGMTVSQLARKLIRDGLTNAEIWVKLKEQFSLADNKRYYPAWYRAEFCKQEAKAA